MLDSLIEGLEDDPGWSKVGPITGLVVALAAGVVSEAARSSDGPWEEAHGVGAQAAALHRRAIRFAREDADAHLIASDALGAAVTAAGERAAGDPPLAAALARAADLPLEIAEVAADVAELAAQVAENGDADRRADAAGAAALAAGAVAAAAHLIDINLSTTPDDERIARAHQLRIAADAASDRGLAASA